MHLKDAFDVLGSEDLASARAREMGSPGTVAPPLGRRLTRFKKYSTRVVITFRDVESSSPLRDARVALSPETSRETKTTVVGQRGPARLLAIYCPVKRRIKIKRKRRGRKAERQARKRVEGEMGAKEKARRGANGRVPAVIQRNTSVSSLARRTHSDGNA